MPRKIGLGPLGYICLSRLLPPQDRRTEPTIFRSPVSLETYGPLDYITKPKLQKEEIKMKCNKCDNEKTKVLDTRPFYGETKRRRECVTCGHRFSTIEAVFNTKREEE